MPSLRSVVRERVIDPLLELTAVTRRLPSAVLSGQTAGWLHGLDLPYCHPVEVIVPDAHASNRAGVRLQRISLSPGEIVQVKELPVTSGLRTAIDLGGRRPFEDAVIALDMALHQGIVSLAELGSYLAVNRGRKGSANLRRAVRLAEPARNRRWRLVCASGLYWRAAPSGPGVSTRCVWSLPRSSRPLLSRAPAWHRIRRRQPPAHSGRGQPPAESLTERGLPFTTVHSR